MAMATVLLLSFLLTQTYGGKESDKVSVKARQYNCPYYYMMMNSGPQVSALSPWLLLAMAIAAVVASVDNMSLRGASSNRDSNSK